MCLHPDSVYYCKKCVYCALHTARARTSYRSCIFLYVYLLLLSSLIKSQAFGSKTMLTKSQTFRPSSVAKQKLRGTNTVFFRDVLRLLWRKSRGCSEFESPPATHDIATVNFLGLIGSVFESKYSLTFPLPGGGGTGRSAVKPETSGRSVADSFLQRDLSGIKTSSWSYHPSKNGVRGWAATWLVTCTHTTTELMRFTCGPGLRKCIPGV